MKKILMTMAAVSALAIGAPAAAQYAGGDARLGVQQLQAQLQAGVRSGAISRREARPLDDQIRQIDDYARVNGRDGLSGRERLYIRQRIANLSQHIRYAEMTGSDRGGRYGRDDRYDNGRAYGANDQGYGRYGANGYGANTVFDDVLKTVGAINLAAEHGLEGYQPVNFEQIAMWDPDWIIAGADRGQTKTVQAQLLSDPAIAVTRAAHNGHILVLENDIVQPMSPFSARFVTTLANALYGAAG